MHNIHHKAFLNIENNQTNIWYYKYDPLKFIT